ncbi:MAG TPA: 8-oxo-dGTP diphosphatase [Patescibacteria group bacterium]|nr:8-oxo-dGTP diphosphatase [Patescibacteria group bacterium]
MNGQNATLNRAPLKQTTLCLLLRDGQVLLGLKKRGFGSGKWNGFGGKAKDGEDVMTAAIRELQEEISVMVRPEHLLKAAVFKFYYPSQPESNQKVTVFLARQWQGEPAESEEMRPAWFAFAAIPYPQMWPDDKHWLPQVLAGKKLTGEFYFNNNASELAKFRLAEI